MGEPRARRRHRARPRAVVLRRSALRATLDRGVRGHVPAPGAARPHRADRPRDPRHPARARAAALAPGPTRAAHRLGDDDLRQRVPAPGALRGGLPAGAEVRDGRAGDERLRGAEPGRVGRARRSGRAGRGSRVSATIERVDELVRAGSERFGSRPAVLRTVAAGGGGFRYAELDGMVERAAAELSAEGLLPGERVLLALAGSPEWAAAFFGLLRAGLVAVPILQDTPAPAVAAAAALAGARHVVVGKGAAGPPDTGLRALSVERLLRADRRAGSAPARSHPAAAMLAFTSGSTARPR